MTVPGPGELAARIERALAGRERRRVVREGASRAAGAVMVGGAADPAVAFIRRKVRAGDPWSGQMAFPGGFRASAEEALETTASRETLEETGLDLAHEGRLLGALDELSPRTPHLPPLIVAPFAFAVPSEPPLMAGDEADDALWIPVRELVDPANRTIFTLALPAGERSFPGILVRDRVIWGLTERILFQLWELVGS